MKTPIEQCDFCRQFYDTSKPGNLKVSFSSDKTELYVCSICAPLIKKELGI